MEAWRNFKEGVWCDEINVSNFIKLNYTPYDGDSSFLSGPTERTSVVLEKVKELLIKENENNKNHNIHIVIFLVSTFKEFRHLILYITVYTELEQELFISL